MTASITHAIGDFGAAQVWLGINRAALVDDNQITVLQQGRLGQIEAEQFKGIAARTALR